MGKIFLFLSLLMTLYGSDIKAVYDVTTGDIATFERKVLQSTATHAAYYEGELKEYEAVFVIHGDAYAFMVDDLSKTPWKGAWSIQKHQELRSRILNLMENYEVRFEVCGIGLRKHQIESQQLMKGVKTIFSSTTGLIRWQDEGFAYIPIR